MTKKERYASTLCGLQRRAENLLELATGIAVAEFGERALVLDLLRSAHKAAPGRPRQRTADADPPNAEIGKNGYAQFARTADQDVDRLRRHRLHDCGDLFPRADAGRVQTVGPGLGECDETLGGGAEIGLP